MRHFCAVCALATAVVACGSLAPDAAATSGNMVITESTRLTEDHQGQIVVSASRITLNCGGHRILGPGLAGVTLAAVTGVTLKNCNVSGFMVGVLVGASDANAVRDNRADGNLRYGFVVSGSNGNTLAGNHAVNNGFGTPLIGGGFALARSARNVVSDNVSERNRDDGFRLGDGSSQNELVRNAVTGNTFSGISLFDAHENLVAHNTLAGNATTGLLLFRSRDNAINSNVASNNGFSGIDLRDGSDRNVIDRNRALGQGVTGILVLDGHSNVVSLNSTEANGFAGIDVRGSADDTRIESNRSSQNGEYGVLVTGGTSGTSLSDNIAFGNGLDGIRVDDAATRVAGNTAKANALLGIRAVPGVADGGGNRATRNGDFRQCVGVACG